MAWTVLQATSTDVESPLSETLFTEIRGNLDYLFDSGVRGGTFATPVRLTLARGQQLFTVSFASGGPGGATAAATEVLKTFSSDSDDGDPKFDAKPRVFFSVEEDSPGTGLDWFTDKVMASPYVVDGTLTASVFNMGCIGYRSVSGAAATNGFEVIVNWMALGPVTSGE